MAKVIIACGGTGGHMAPGIAVAQALRKQDHQCRLLVSRKQVDNRLSSSYQELDFLPMPGAAFSLHPLRMARFAWAQVRSLVAHAKLMKSYKPDVVMAFGGFTSLGCVVTAWLFGVPVALHEANRKPGKATRVLRRFANRIYLPEGIRLRNRLQSNVLYLGYPLREAFSKKSKESAREFLNLPTSGKLLVVLGGSQGAMALNNWVDEHWSKLAADGINVYCITGLSRGEGEERTATAHDGSKSHLWLVPFTDTMELVLSAADLAISRAGAGSIAEMTQCLLPSILIPYPYAADDHQRANALFLESQAGCVVIDQNNISSLLGEVQDMIFNDWMLERMRDNLRSIRREDTTSDIVRDLLSFARHRAPKGILLEKVRSKNK